MNQSLEHSPEALGTEDERILITQDNTQGQGRARLAARNGAANAAGTTEATLLGVHSKPSLHDYVFQSSDRKGSQPYLPR